MSELIQIGRHHFRFQCQPGCTNCCTQPGEVYLTAEDLARIARGLDLTPRQFKRKFCQEEEDGLRLTTPKEKSCHFLLEGSCSIHAVKPLQCRTFPFWPENVRNKRSWKRAGQNCPGIGVGDPLSREDVRREAELCHDAFPDF